MRDSYERFFSKGYISKEQFFDFGISETIYAPLDTAKIGWEKLKQRITTNQDVYMRGFGQGGAKSHMYQEFYKQILGNENVVIDATNNEQPTAVIEDMTGYSKTKKTETKDSNHKLIRNYQVAHIFGRTKNIYTFTAPWNIAYLPKIIDPFTGHEAKGEMINEYKIIFQQKSYARFKPLIEEYNKLISDSSFMQRVDSYLEYISNKKSYSPKDINILRTSVRKEFAPISI
jgi:hypothetical protein